MEASLLSKVVLPFALFVVMFGMGLSLTLGEFKQIARGPKPIFVGIFGQLIILPLLGIGLYVAFSLEPILAVGILAIAVSPGGVTSNMFTYLAKGNTALSITLTAIVSLVTPFTAPILLNWKMTELMGQSSQIQLPVVKTILTLLAMTVVPVAIGMVIKNKKPVFAARAELSVKYVSIVFLLLIVIGISVQNLTELPSFFAKVGWPVFILNAGSMVIGFFFAKAVGLSLGDQKTVGIEVGIQNGTTALFITSTLLDDPVMSIPAATYSLIMFVTGALCAWYFGRMGTTKD